MSFHRERYLSNIWIEKLWPGPSRLFCREDITGNVTQWAVKWPISELTAYRTKTCSTLPRSPEEGRSSSSGSSLCIMCPASDGSPNLCGINLLCCDTKSNYSRGGGYQGIKLWIWSRYWIILIWVLGSNLLKLVSSAEMKEAWDAPT